MTPYDFYILLLLVWAFTGGFILGRMTAKDRPRHRKPDQWKQMFRIKRQKKE